MASSHVTQFYCHVPLHWVLGSEKPLKTSNPSPNSHPPGRISGSDGRLFQNFADQLKQDKTIHMSSLFHIGSVLHALSTERNGF